MAQASMEEICERAGQRLANERYRRHRAAQALAWLCGRQWNAPLNYLLVALVETDSEVRRAAATALGQLKDTRAVEPLLSALHDTDSEVRRAAAEALGQLGDARAVEPLLSTLEDHEPFVCEAAVQALGRLGDARAVRPLLRRLPGKTFLC
jgi:HEAT repeat protein